MDKETNTERDAGKLLSIFPEEIWLKISDSLEDNDDKEKFANSSMFIWKILTPKRTTFLFPKVWKLFGPNFELSEWSQWNEKESQNSVPKACDVCGRDRFIQPYSSVLNLRLVCKEWSQAIDKIYKFDPSQFEDDEGPDDDASFFLWRIQAFDSYVEDDQYFHQLYRHFHKTHSTNGTGRSPLFAREVSIHHAFDGYAREAIDARPLFNEIPNFLRKYGQHVEYLNISMWVETPVAQTYSRLNSWLKLVPNLKTLELNILPFKHNGKIQEISLAELTELEQVINISPLPVLEKLEFIKIRSCPTLIFSHLTRRNSQLKMLKIFKNQQPHTFAPNSIQLSLPNLKKFSTTIYTTAELENVSVLLGQSTLKTLQLDIKLADVEWRRIFNFLEKCDVTLTELVLKLPKDSRTDNHPPQLNLHYVKSLKLTLPSYIPLDFLMSMNGVLECLDVKVHKENADNSNTSLVECTEMNNTIKFFSCVGTPARSNIWSIFHKLKCVSFSEVIESDGFAQESMLFTQRRFN